MKLTFQSGDLDISSISGLVLTGTLDTQTGFGSTFKVIAIIESDLEYPFEDIALTEEPLLGELKITGPDVNHTFDPALLREINTSVGRRLKRQILVFDVDFSRPDEFPSVTLENSSATELRSRALSANRYTVGLDDDLKEEVLGFDTMFAVDGDQAIRTRHVVNGKNSWATRLVAWSKREREDIKLSFGSAITVSDPVVIDRASARYVHFIQRFGLGLKLFSAPPVTDLFEGRGLRATGMGCGFGDDEFVRQEMGRSGAGQGDLHTTEEIATVILRSEYASRTKVV